MSRKIKPMSHKAHAINGARLKLAQKLLDQINKETGPFLRVQDPARGGIDRASQHLWKSRSAFENNMFHDHREATTATYYGEARDTELTLQGLLKLDAQLARLEPSVVQHGVQTAVRNARENLATAVKRIVETSRGTP